MRTPLLIIIIRLLFLAILGIILYFYHLAIRSGNEFEPRIIATIAIPAAICLFILIVSFIRKQWSLWLLVIFSTALPLAFWILFDTSGVVHDDSFWGKAIDWLIVFPTQMLIPVALSYELFTQTTVRRFYLFNGPERS